MEILTISPNQTKKTGTILAKEILKSSLRDKAFVFGLEGDLGGGKTTFLQGFTKGLGIGEKILSPTFVILKKFEIPRTKASLVRGRRNPEFKIFYHIDCYRIKKAKEILDLGFKEIISNPKNIVAVEWADRIRQIMPKGTIWLKFRLVDKNKRKIVVKPR
ncbi:MAG: tRNA (adenosine(37)-N6)-threonylcarbamoyltransferase complex ATPase subunit type 1 TsaE [Candidatus Paceibacterales bacterium]